MTPEVFKLLEVLKEIKTRSEADYFLDCCKKEGMPPEELGFILGYMQKSEQDRLNELFGISHPVFDNPILKNFENPSSAGKFVVQLEESFKLLKEYLK
ncbi:MAG: hypothetical protein WCG45_01600 [bacterium]